jgi:hypothetical protein
MYMSCEAPLKANIRAWPQFGRESTARRRCWAQLGGCPSFHADGLRVACHQSLVINHCKSFEIQECGDRCL